MFVMSWRTLYVLLIYCASNVSEIFNSVVLLIAVYVVNLVRGPSSYANCPYNSVYKQLAPEICGRYVAIVASYSTYLFALPAHYSAVAGDNIERV